MSLGQVSTPARTVASFRQRIATGPGAAGFVGQPLTNPTRSSSCHRSKRALAPGSRGRSSTVAQAQATVKQASQTGKKEAEGPADWAHVEQYAETAYLTARNKAVAKHFPTALGVDDFINRLEVALFAYGFAGDNSIAMTNLCRDEITATLKNKLDQVFGQSFNTNGLGGVLTCGVTGMGAGFSHSPISAGSGKERYVFFSFPHIGIDADGKVGNISRPGRPGDSCACGALAKALGEIRGEGLQISCKRPGEHDARDPEYSILKQRLARRIRHEGRTEEYIRDLDLVEITKVAERTITDDLEYLIGKTVDPKKADYAVVTGVQIHNYSSKYEDDTIPNLEFVAPTTVYSVVGGTKTYLDLFSIPSLTPRQIRLLSSVPGGPPEGPGADDEVCGMAGDTTTLRGVEDPDSYSGADSRRMRRARAAKFAALLDEGAVEVDNLGQWPGWQSRLVIPQGGRGDGDNSTVLDEKHFNPSFEVINDNGNA